MKASFYSLGLLFMCSSAPAASAPPIPTFRAVEIDSKIQIGYAVTVADVDGDKKPDILVVDKKQIVWYRNPTWEKFVIAENLTPQDNVCIAAADIDGDGKAEIAVGAGWNPNDTENSGAVFYLIPPKDRTQKWEPVELPHEPTVHRMRWMRSASGKFELVVAPLHGRGDKNGEGAGVKILAYQMPANPRDPWKTELINDSLHMTHNFELVHWDKQQLPELLVAAREGVFHLVLPPGRLRNHVDFPGPDGVREWRSASWLSSQLGGNKPGEAAFTGAGEIRVGKLPGGNPFMVTVEPMHGNQLVIYTRPAHDSSGLWNRQVLDSSLKEGHALACSDLLGVGSDQIVIGWRGKDADGKVGIKLFVPSDNEGKNWKPFLIDDNTMACEDLCLADLNGDGKLDIIASGRATKNVKIYFNEGTK